MNNNIRGGEEWEKDGVWSYYTVVDSTLHELHITSLGRLTFWLAKIR